MELYSLVQEFADCVAAQNAAVKDGDAQKGNEFAKRYISAFDRIREQGDNGREALATLLDDDRVGVRVMAAAFLLRYCRERALPVLEREAQGRGLVAFGASQTLQRWNEGTWNLDPAIPSPEPERKYRPFKLRRH